MTTASALVALNQDIVNARTAITNKGGTVTSGGGSYQLATDIATIPSGGSSPVITSLSITPTTSSQTITAPSGTDGYSPITVSAVTSNIDNNIQAANIVSGVSILGVNGSAVELNGETRSVSITSTAGNTFTPSSGKNAITSITVTPTNEARTVSPSTSSQSLTVNSGYSGNGTITVNPVTSSIDANITAGNIKKDVTILGVTGTYEGSGGGKYKILDRVKTYTNVEIGTVSGFFTDANNVEYAVVCLDAKYRLASGKYCSNNSAITNLASYASWSLWTSKDTATHNTQLILNYCSSKGYTSTACNHCRGLSFLIDEEIYTGQLPNIVELSDICRHYSAIQSADTSVSQYSSLGLPRSSDRTWSSTQYNGTYSWCINNAGSVTNGSKNLDYFVIPVLEIPNN